MALGICLSCEFDTLRHFARCLSNQPRTSSIGITPDTAVTPFDQRTSSSRSTVHLGVAAQRAAQDAARRAAEAAARLLGAPAEALCLTAGRIEGGPKPMSIGQLLKAPGAGFGGEIIGVGDFVPERPEAPTSFGMRAGYWEGSVGAAHVAVERQEEQGRHRDPEEEREAAETGHPARGAAPAGLRPVDRADEPGGLPDDRRREDDERECERGSVDDGVVLGQLAPDHLRLYFVP